MSEAPKPRALPTRWFTRLFWSLQRGVYSFTGGRIGVRTATTERWGMLRLRAIGRRSGAERAAILGYFEDGPNLVTMATNGWADPEPAWWLNLQAQPMRSSISRADHEPFAGGRRGTTSGRDCGLGGRSTTPTSTSTPLRRDVLARRPS